MRAHPRLRARPLVTALLAGLVAAALLVLGAPAPAVAAPGQQGPDAPADDGTGGSSDEGEEVGEPVPAEDIIPLPNSGREPSDAGDRGGALQVLVLVAIVAGVGGATAMLVRESRRNRDRARQP